MPKYIYFFIDMWYRINMRARISAATRKGRCLNEKNDGNIALLYNAAGVIPTTVYAESAPAVTATYTKGILQLAWTSSEVSGEDYTPKDVEINNETYTKWTEIKDGVITVDVTLSNGTYNGTFNFTNAENVTVSSKIKVVVSLTAEELLGFKFNEIDRQFDSTSHELSVKWNYADAKGADITAIRLDGKRKTIDGKDGQFTALLTDVLPGFYTLTYIFKLADGKTEVELSADELVLPGETKTKMTVVNNNGVITATITDTAGKPIANYPIVLTLDDSSYSAKNTDKNGKITFTQKADSDTKIITCTAEDFKVGDVTYIGCTASPKSSSNSTTGSDSTTADTSATSNASTNTTTTKKKTTTSTTKATTTKAPVTYAVISGAGTTGVIDGLLAVNVSYDEGILRQFDLKGEDFASRGRLLMPQETYKSLVGDTTNTVMLSVRYSSIEVLDKHISTAISNISKYSSYHAEDVKRITIDLSMQYIDRSTNTNVDISTLPDSAYTVQLPVPNSMKDIGLIAVSATNADGLTSLVQAEVDDGYLRFVTKQMSTITILGFTEVEKKATTGGIPNLALIFLSVGFLMIVGAGFLFYFFILRKPAVATPPQGPTSPDGTQNTRFAQSPYDTQNPLLYPKSEDSSDILSKTLSESESKNPPAELDDRDVYSSEARRLSSIPNPVKRPTDVSLGSFQNRQTPNQPEQKKKNPKDYDLDL